MNKEETNLDLGYTCSECGKHFDTYYQLSIYPWKVTKDKILVQCDYNCHNHALLRFNKLGKMSLTKLREEVRKSEGIMTAKGKTIQHPIDTTGTKSKGNKSK